MHGGEQWKKKENNSNGHYGAKPERKHRTEVIVIIVLRPYAPAGAKKEGEGEGIQNGDVSSLAAHVIGPTEKSLLNAGVLLTVLLINLSAIAV